MNKTTIPNGHRVEDFSLSLFYMSNGSTADPLPGFRLQALFADAGTAYSLLGGGAERWDERVRVAPQTVTNVLTTLAADPHVPGELMNYGGVFADYVSKAVRQRQAIMVRRVRDLRQQLAAAEAALEAEGLPRDS